MIPADHESYSEFALVFDAALGRRFFYTVSSILEKVLERHPRDGREHLDVACGTGLALRWFSDRGFRSTGTDASLSMLSVARNRSSRLLACDMRALAVRRSFSHVTCLYDSLNHLLTPADLIAAFSSVRSVLAEDGLFLFDVNHPDAYPRVWGLAEPFVARDAGYRLSIDTTWDGATGIGTGRITGWILSGGERIEIREEHRQRPYAEGEISAALREARLEPLEMIPFDPFGENLEGLELKMFFVAGAAG